MDLTLWYRVVCTYKCLIDVTEAWVRSYHLKLMICQTGEWLKIVLLRINILMDCASIISVEAGVEVNTSLEDNGTYCENT